MPRIPTATIETIKQRVRLVELLLAEGRQLERGGRDWVTCCPLHDDTNPSLRITPKDESPDLWRCPVCDIGGDVYQWQQKIHGLAFRQAHAKLLEHLGEEVPEEDAAHNSTLPTLSLPPHIDKQGALSEVLRYYQKRLTPDSAGHDYLLQRGIYLQTAHYFQLGYADRTLTKQLPATRTKDGAALRSTLIETGLVRGTGREHLNGCIVVPIKNPLRLHGPRARGRRRRLDVLPLKILPHHPRPIHQA